MSTDEERKTLEFINSCQKAENLLDLPLTHPQARALFQYREKYGHLASLEELLKVHGIGKRTLEKVKDWIASAQMNASIAAPSRRLRFSEKLLAKKVFLGLVKSPWLDYRHFIVARKHLQQGEEAVAFFMGRGPDHSRVLILISTQRILVLGGWGAYILFSYAVSNTEEQIGLLDLKGRYCSVMFLDNENSAHLVVSKVPIKIASRVKLLIDGPESIGPYQEMPSQDIESIKGDAAIPWIHKARAKKRGRKTDIEPPRLAMFYVGAFPFLLAWIVSILVWPILLLGNLSVLGLFLLLLSLLALLAVIVAILFVRRKYNERCFLKRLSQAHYGIPPTQVYRLLKYLEKHGSVISSPDMLHGKDYEEQIVAKSEFRQVSPTVSELSAGDSLKRENADFTSKQAVWTAIIGYFVLYAPLYYLGRISYGWFIGCAVVGSMLGLLALLTALGNLFSGQKRTAIAISVMVLSVAVALGAAFGDLPKPSIQNNEPNALSQIPATMTYQILDEETSDVPIKTQVTVNLLVSGTITQEGLKKLLGNFYREIMARRGFKYHEAPTNVYIFAYTSKERAESGYLWIAMLDKSYSDSGPKISINERQLALLGLEPGDRFGLTEEQRVAIFQEIVLAEDQALAEAMAKYPDLIPGTRNYSQEAFRHQLDRQIEETDRLKEEYKEQLATKHGLTREQLDMIATEGLEKDWPIPALP